MLKTDLLSFGVTGAVFKIAGEMRWLPAYFDNPEKRSFDGKCAIPQYTTFDYQLIQD